MKSYVLDLVRSANRILYFQECLRPYYEKLIDTTPGYVGDYFFSLQIEHFVQLTDEWTLKLQALSTGRYLK